MRVVGSCGVYHTQGFVRVRYSPPFFVGSHDDVFSQSNARAFHIPDVFRDNQVVFRDQNVRQRKNFLCVISAPVKMLVMRTFGNVYQVVVEKRNDKNSGAARGFCDLQSVYRRGAYKDNDIAKFKICFRYLRFQLVNNDAVFVAGAHNAAENVRIRLIARVITFVSYKNVAHTKTSNSKNHRVRGSMRSQMGRARSRLINSLR